MGDVHDVGEGVSGLSRLVDGLLRAAGRLIDAEPRMICGADGSAYLTRYTLVDFGKHRYRIYLHEFHRGDEDAELHSHPWDAVSFVIHGGYREERLVDDRVVVRILRPISLNRLRTTTFHRVDLLGWKAWSVLWTGPVVSSWGFFNVETKVYTPWRAFLAAKVARRAVAGAGPHGAPDGAGRGAS